MPLFKKNQEKAKSLRQQLAEEESGWQIRHVVDPKPQKGQVYEGDYWVLGCEDAERFMKLDGCHADWTDEMRVMSRRLDAAIEAHPGLLSADLSAHHYDTLDDALCALERALYGFDLSGRKAEPERKPDPKPAFPEPDPEVPNPSVTLELLTGGADSKTGAVRVLCDRVLFGDYDPSGIYDSIERAVGALNEAVMTDPYAKREKKKGK